jgi:hypothetical protein
VPVTGGSVSVELLRRQLDLATGIAALLAVDMRGRAPFARALESLPDRHLIWNPSQRPLSRGQRNMPYVAVGISAEQLLAVR